MAFKPGDRMGFSGKPWPQYPAEIDDFIRLLVAEGCRSYLEVGCRYGDSWHAVGTALPAGSRLVAVDLPGGARGLHADSGVCLTAACCDLIAKGRDARMFLGSSHDPATIAQVEQLAPFDAVFIDGDHSDAGMRADWRDYGKLARIVAFHDLRNRADMRRLWAELAPKYRHREISISRRHRGIGVLWRT